MTVHSLSDLRTAWSTVHPEVKLAKPKVRKERPRKCRICGAEMEHISGSNVYICHGTIEKPDPCKEDPNRTKQIPCTNYILAR